MSEALVCNTSPLLYLGRLGRLELLPALYDTVFVPEPVIWELDAGRLLRPDTLDPRRLEWLTRVVIEESATSDLPPNRLGPGERAVIAYARTRPGHIAGLDDHQARLLAQQLGLSVAGTVGILVRAKRLGLVGLVRPLLDSLQSQGFRLSAKTYDEAVRLAGE